MPKPLHFFFDFASTYSYVAALRIEAECARAAVPLVFRPFVLGALFSEQLGISDSPFNVHPVRGRYMWRDLERLCARYRLPWKRPSAFPRHSVAAARLACAAEGEPWQGELVRAFFRANFAADREIAEEPVLTALLAELGQAAAPLLARATAPEVRARLRANTDEARALGVFGAPNFVVEGELFFGQDRLADALEWAGR
jgi:2-hydroxychromene-2-carboxylate isomerase